MIWSCHRESVRWPMTVPLAAVVILGLANCSVDAEPTIEGLQPDPSPPVTFEPGDVELLQPRAVHHATVLADGRVLVTGGCTEPGCEGFDAARASEIFNPTKAVFVPGPTMPTPSASGTATLLGDGGVLLTGGYPGEGMPPTSNAQVFDPGTGRFSAVAPMTTERATHTATLLRNGRVLMSGGYDGQDEPLASTELFDPRTDSFTAEPDLSSPRAAHSAVMVNDFVVLVGGTVGGPALGTTDVLHQGRWGPGPELRTPRVKHAVAALPGARILVVGGSASIEGRARLASTELIHLMTGEVSGGPSLSEGEYKLDGAVVALGDGRVVIAGGQRINVYDPADNTMTVLRNPVLPRRSFVTATPVGRQTVLVAGGYDDAIVPTANAQLVRIPQ